MDLSVVVPTVLLPLLCRSLLRVHKSYLIFASVLLFLIAYQLGVQIGNDIFDVISVGRLVRALIDVILVGLVVGTQSDGDRSAHTILRWLLLSLVVHALLVDIAAVIPALNHALSEISGNDKVGHYRASGLLAGFDIAGFLSAIGMMMVLSRLCPLRRRLPEFAFMVVFLLSCAFTSRVSMVLGVLLFIVYLMQMLRDRELSLTVKLVLIPSIVIVGVGIAYQMFLIFDVTMGLNLMQVSDLKIASIRSVNAPVSIDLAGYKEMFFLPSTSSQFIFGVGKEALHSDVGYVNNIYSFGLIGLVVAVLAHLAFIAGSLKNVPSRRLRNHKLLVTALFVSMLVLTFKNNYIFVRGVFPVFLLIVGVGSVRSKDGLVRERTAISGVARNG